MGGKSENRIFHLPSEEPTDQVTPGIIHSHRARPWNQFPVSTERPTSKAAPDLHHEVNDIDMLERVLLFSKHARRKTLEN